MLFLLALMMVLYDLWDFDPCVPTGDCLIVKPKKSKPPFPFHSSLRSRVWANRVGASCSSSPMPFNHSWIASLHRCMPSHVWLHTTKSSASWMQGVWWVTCLPPLELFPGPPACFTTASRP